MAGKTGLPLKMKSLLRAVKGPHWLDPHPMVSCCAPLFFGRAMFDLPWFKDTNHIDTGWDTPAWLPENHHPRMSQADADGSYQANGPKELNGITKYIQTMATYNCLAHIPNPHFRHGCPARWSPTMPAVWMITSSSRKLSFQNVLKMLKVRRCTLRLVNVEVGFQVADRSPGYCHALGSGPCRINVSQPLIHWSQWANVGAVFLKPDPLIQPEPDP